MPGHKQLGLGHLPKLFLLCLQALLPGADRRSAGIRWTETPYAFSLEFITKLNRICDVQSNLDFPVVTTGAGEAAGVFLRERNIRLGVGSPENRSSLVTSGKVHLWTSVSAPVLSRPNVQL